jgi:outer membrane protein TolC
LQGLQEGAVRSAESALALAKKGYDPDVQIRVEAWQYEGKSGIQEYDAGVSVNFPWFNHGKYKAAVNEARANLDATRDELDAMRVQTAAEVNELYDGIHTMHHHYELYVGQLIPQQQLAVDAARSAYESGTGGFLDILDARRMLFDLEMQNLHHAAEFQRLLASLE